MACDPPPRPFGGVTGPDMMIERRTMAFMRYAFIMWAGLRMYFAVITNRNALFQRACIPFFVLPAIRLLMVDPLSSLPRPGSVHHDLLFW